jgi:hypothetical protein
VNVTGPSVHRDGIAGHDPGNRRLATQAPF